MAEIGQAVVPAAETDVGPFSVIGNGSRMQLVQDYANAMMGADDQRLAAEIDKCVDSAEHHARGAVAAALLAGNLLRIAKSRVQHGDWEAWLTAHCRLAPRTAQAYMRLATKVAELPAVEAQRVADLPLRAAIAAVATPADPPPAYGPRGTSFKSHDFGVARGLMEASSRSLGSIGRDLGMRKITLDRIKTAQEKLRRALAELERMEASARKPKEAPKNKVAPADA